MSFLSLLSVLSWLQSCFTSIFMLYIHYQVDGKLDNYNGLPTVKLEKSKSHYEAFSSKEAAGGYGYPSELSTLPKLTFSEVCSITEFIIMV